MEIITERLEREFDLDIITTTPSVRYREQDDPVFDVTNPNQQDSASINLGVDVPMRTGGRASIDLDQGWNQTDNPFFTFLDAQYVNDGKVIRENPKVVAVNSAIEVDLTGQVCADSIGTYQFSGVGGQMDFMRGAALSEGGKPIIALCSTTGTGASKIVPFLKQGAGVVTTRAHVHYVVTEHGVAYLYGKNLQQRAKALIGIAAPEHREELERAYRERFQGPRP